MAAKRAVTKDEMKAVTMVASLVEKTVVKKAICWAAWSAVE